MIRSDDHTVGLVAALRTEIGPLLRALRCRKVEGEKGLLHYGCAMGDKRIHFVETGIGWDRAVEGARWLLQHCSPRLLISMGFSGGLTEDLEPGDTIYGIRSVQFDPGTSLLDRVRTLKSMEDETCLQSWLRPGTIVTSSAPPNKRELSRLLPEEWNPAVVDMETAHLAGIAESWATPFIYIRSVCDELGMEPDLRIDRLTDEWGRVRPSMVFRYALREPGALVRLVGLARRAGVAAQALKRAVVSILQRDL